MSDGKIKAWIAERSLGRRRGPQRSREPDFDSLSSTWETLGQEDPLWAVLQFPGKEGGGWDPDEFFKHGEHEIDRILDVVEGSGWTLRRGSALDFGCGAGRLTQALCRHFERVDGVDIAASMIEAAERLNRYPDRCHYHLNKAQDLALFADGSFDFIYSILVLQHMHPTFARAYVGEFVRVLGAGGLAVFEITTGVSKLGGRAMESKGFRADLEIQGDAPGDVPSGGVLRLDVHVTNTSQIIWPARGEHAVRLGARWRQDGKLSEAEEARTDLRADLSPGGAETLTLAARSPRTPGRYTLEVGLLQEGVAWFVDKGGPSARVDVSVSPSTGTSGIAERSEPHVEMYVTPPDEVTRWVDDAGGVVVRMLNADQPEVGYEGRVFFATRRA
jgi:SAM-dependent methyltransferase